MVRTTSSLVDVMSDDRDVINKFGMMSDVVLPLRLGPSTNVDRCSPLDTS